jgi:hypothetical protein
MPTPTRTRPPSAPTRSQSFQSQSTTTSEAPPKTRTRGRPIRPNRPTPTATTYSTTTTTTTTTPRPTFRAIFTTSSTTPSPSYDDGSEEYYDDDNERIVDTVEQIPQKQKGSIRPVFSNQIQELQSPRFQYNNEDPPPPPPPPSTTQRRVVRPTPSPEGVTPFPGSRNNNNQNRPSGNRGREQSTLESPTASFKTTTGKPLYYAGKMLSKEGGVYAGQNIPSTHVYGSPVPALPFNSVFDKASAIIESHERPLQQSRERQQQPQKNNQQQRVRSRDRNANNDDQSFIPLSTPSSSVNSRLVHPSRVRQQQHQQQGELLHFSIVERDLWQEWHIYSTHTKIRFMFRNEI